MADISCESAQIILPCGCEKYLREYQNITMRIKTTLKDTDILVAAQVRSVTPAQDHDAMRVEVQFTELENNPEAKTGIVRICEYAEKLKAVNAT